MHHDLKTWPSFFAAIASGVKTFELRKDDRHFSVGDVLLLREWEPMVKAYTGRSVTRHVTHMLCHDPDAGCAATFGLLTGYVILSIADSSLKKDSK